MKKLLILAALFTALTGGVAEAQYWGRPMMGGGYRGAQQWGFDMGDRAKRHGLATDCTDYGYGDCAERMARSGRHPGWGITGGGGGQRHYGGGGWGYHHGGGAWVGGGGSGQGYRGGGRIPMSPRQVNAMRCQDLPNPVNLSTPNRERLMIRAGVSTSGSFCFHLWPSQDYRADTFVVLREEDYWRLRQAIFQSGDWGVINPAIKVVENIAMREKVIPPSALQSQSTHYEEEGE